MKSNNFGLISALVVALAVFATFHHNILAAVGYLGSCTGIWAYHRSPWYLAYLKQQREKLPYVDATPIPEIAASDFTKELLWEVTNNLRGPVVIRGAIAQSDAVKLWNKDYFVENYGDNLVVVRETRNDTRLRVVRVPMRDFWAAFDQGLNVSIIASSSIFEIRPELKDQIAAPFQKDIVDKAGHDIFASQLFSTPGGRSHFHAAIGGNVFRQVSGRKTWTVVSPSYSRWMCPYPVIAATSVNTCIIDLPIDEREDWVKRLPRQYATLEPGDIYYNPPWYWHDVNAVGSDTRQASVAGRIRTISQSFANAPVQSFAMLVEQLTSKLRGKVIHADEEDPTITVATQLEDNIIASWSARCVAEGFSDCYGLPINRST